ncbi:MAG: response regulator transcription factor [Spirochaetales bacterium]|nr:response regulator transcription factor [Spirochaetales bacterium]
MPYNILLVDDDRYFRNEFKEYFSDYNVVEAEDGRKAIQILNKINIIDLVILDIKMPGLQGTKVLSEIKKINSKLYTIILTGFSSEDRAIEALQAHADDYLIKPVNFIKLKATIDNLMIDLKYQENIDADSNKEKIEKVKLYVEKNYTKVFNLNDIAEIIFLSPKYLSKIFKQQTGIGFNKYRINVKIKYAEELLTTTDYHIDQIAYKLGYKKSESFIKVFKNYSNMTPTEYRNQIRKNNE